jgi:hypothetical protein
VKYFLLCGFVWLFLETGIMWHLLFE